MKKTKNHSQLILYYLLRVGQRFSLLALGLLTLVYWALLVSVTTGVTLAQQEVSHQFKNPEQLNGTIDRAVSLLAHGVVRWAILTALLTAAMLLFVRVRKYEKRFLVDSTVIIVFCLLSVILARMIIRAFVARLS